MSGQIAARGCLIQQYLAGLFEHGMGVEDSVSGVPPAPSRTAPVKSVSLEETWLQALFKHSI
jgi:hypothetical protein